MKLKPPPLPALLTDSRNLLEIVRSMPLPEGQAGTRFLDGLKILEEVVALGRSRMKQLLEEAPDAVPHWRMMPGASVREIHAPGTKIRAAIGEELDDDSFLDVGKWSFSQLESAYMEANSVDRAAAALAVGRLLEKAGCVTIRTNAPSLKRL
jgi:hypothetical protein